MVRPDTDIPLSPQIEYLPSYPLPKSYAYAPRRPDTLFCGAADLPTIVLHRSSSPAAPSLNSAPPPNRSASRYAHTQDLNHLSVYHAKKREIPLLICQQRLTGYVHSKYKKSGGIVWLRWKMMMERIRLKRREMREPEEVGKGEGEQKDKRENTGETMMVEARDGEEDAAARAEISAEQTPAQISTASPPPPHLPASLQLPSQNTAPFKEPLNIRASQIGLAITTPDRVSSLPQTPPTARPQQPARGQGWEPLYRVTIRRPDPSSHAPISQVPSAARRPREPHPQQPGPVYTLPPVIPGGGPLHMQARMAMTLNQYQMQQDFLAAGHEPRWVTADGEHWWQQQIGDPRYGESRWHPSALDMVDWSDPQDRERDEESGFWARCWEWTCWGPEGRPY